MQAKKPTRAQKIFLKSKGLNPENWLVISDDRRQIVIQPRHSSQFRTIKKET